MKQAVWVKSTLKHVQQFPDEIRKELGFFLFQLQIGKILEMPHSRSMPSLGKSCFELRIKDGYGAYRIFYYLKIESEIFVFHAFQKKTEKTSLKDLDQGKRNLKEYLNEKK